jgi:radical SAM superfamily enzyme YgiQ (UPF0313 family)
MKMKITFIRPHISHVPAADAMEPLVFAMLSSYLPDTIDVELYDDRIETVPLDLETDLIAMTVETYTAKRAYGFADEFRSRGIPVIMGGYHPTFLPDEALEHADAVVVGDSEDIWLSIIADYEKDQLKKIYRSTNTQSLKNISPDRSLFNNKKYSPISLVQYGRGCQYACDFCSIYSFYGNKNLRQRPIVDVVREIESLDKKHVFIVDDNLFIDREKTMKFIEALVPLNIKWSCQASIDIGADSEMLNLMQKSGCFNTLIGFESLNPKNLSLMHKKWNMKFGGFKDVISRIHDNGILIYATFIFGYDNDTPASFESTLDFALENQFFLANFNPLMPMPGATLYSRLKNENRLLFDKWWLDPEFKYGDAAFIPKNMTPDELTERCFSIRKEFNTYSNIFNRAINMKTNSQSLYHLGMYTLANLVNRKELYNKQAVALG